VERGCKEKAARFLPADFWAKKRGTAGVVFRSMDSLSGFLCGSCCGQGCLLGFLICRELLLRRLQGESIADKELSVLLAREQLVPRGARHDVRRSPRNQPPACLAKRPEYSKNPMAVVAAKLAELVALWLYRRGGLR
jgi:hypothetical protein